LLEAALARQIPEMDPRTRTRAATTKTVAATLPESSALVEFIRFDVRNFDSVLARAAPWGPPRYVAFVVRAGADGARMVELGDAEPIDRLIRSLREGLEASWGPDDSGAEQWMPAGLELVRAVFEPLVASLAGITRLFIAPDGDLNTLPFEVLPVGDGLHLIDRYEISYVTSGRDVLLFDRPLLGDASDPLVAADPDFNLASRREELLPAASRPQDRQSRDLDSATLWFARLPGTRAEGVAVAAILRVAPLLDHAVLETRLKACRSPRILHLATHGFFLPDQERPWFERVSDPASAESGGGMDGFQGVSLENPLLRSGLALSAANTWLRGGTPPEEAEDGILTAEDASGLDLTGTELVVLSACDTGLGEVHRFRIAPGVHTGGRQDFDHEPLESAR
jgi:hypothetical protein